MLSLRGSILVPLTFKEIPGAAKSNVAMGDHAAVKPSF
jgi:hypothetical protein